ncbi:MAG: hypothetical protein DRN04_13775 [Thermoprotei archaeon]|nr:MAG: hypothetical protein DRN04_13775 [Thermoprotei archaeon]
MHAVERELGRTRVWGRWYTTIPVTVRRVLGLKPGDEIEWILTEQGIVVRKAQVRGDDGGV